MPQERNYRDTVDSYLYAWKANKAQVNFYDQLRSINGKENKELLPNVDDKKVDQLMGFLRANNGGTLWIAGNGHQEMDQSRAQAVALGFVLEEITTNLKMPLRIVASSDKGSFPIAEQIAGVTKISLVHDIRLDPPGQGVSESISGIISNGFNKQENVSILVTPRAEEATVLVRGEPLGHSSLSFLALGSATQDGRRNFAIFTHGIFSEAPQPKSGF